MEGRKGEELVHEIGHVVSSPEHHVEEARNLFLVSDEHGEFGTFKMVHEGEMVQTEGGTLIIWADVARDG